MMGILVRRRYLLLVILLFGLHNFPFMQQAEVRFTSTVYMVLKHSDKQHLEYEGLEFEPHFGEYMVTYQNENGENLSISIQSKQFPFVVTYDPLDPPMKVESDR